MHSDTIAAIATPEGMGGIGIIRISGARALDLAMGLFRPSKRPHLGGLDSHRIYHGHIIDPNNGQPLDEVFFLYMQAPRSYTREDVVEVHAHGSGVVLRTILELVVQRGARLAEAGEFTRRAYLNGRIDLAQAEAVIDIINAKSVRALQVATAQAQGYLSDRIVAIINGLNDLCAELEARIEFPDEQEDETDPVQLGGALRERAIEPLEALVAGCRNHHALREGIRLPIIGKPNVGKSSLLNALANKARAIVTAIPGTTRDVVEYTIDIRGFPFILQDTAGLHATRDPIESIGVQKTEECINGAQLVLFMVDASRPLDDDDFIILRRLGQTPHILVWNKIDLLGEGSLPVCPESVTRQTQVRVCAVTGGGLEKLKQVVAQRLDVQPVDGGQALIVPNLRHKIALEEAAACCNRAMEGLRSALPVDLIADDLKAGTFALEAIRGRRGGQELMDLVFSRFCIGK